jgi:NodT family efflux transporter outer membrane factor (OMF) lipoprotein
MNRRVSLSGPAFRCVMLTATLTPLLVSGCKVGPNYHQPSAPTAPAFMEDALAVPPPNPPNGGWKQVAPADSAIRGKWWEIYNDPQLNELEEKIAVSNQSLKASYDAYMQALTAVQVFRSQYFPTVSLSPTIQNDQLSRNRGLYSSGTVTNYNDLVLAGQALWEPDLWGSVRRSVESARATAQATAGDLANLDLSLQSQLASDYFQMRGLDTQKQLLDNAVLQFQQYYELTETRFSGGVATEADVELALTQVEQTRAQSIDVGAARAQFEHAIAVLAGEPASTFSLALAPLNLALPPVPVGVPSQLLERRPDIAAAERRADAANAQIGVAIAAYYPTVTLGGTGGFESQRPGNWLSGPSALWTLGGSATELLFDAGRRHALTEEARLAYDQNVANYRQTVLQAFQEVEDNLADLRVLNDESSVQQRAVAAATRSLTVSTNRYTGGVTTYLEVIIAQTTQLANLETAASINTRQFTASVGLITALGGGWNTTQLPNP